MAKAYHAWTTVVVPQPVFRMLYGEAASFLTSGQRVRPTRLQEAGFHFAVPDVERLFKGTDHSTVRTLDLDRYMGLWYEIARYENRFERGLVDVTAMYTLRPDGTIRVENRGCKRNSPLRYLQDCQRSCQDTRLLAAGQTESLFLSQLLFRLLRLGTGWRELQLCTCWQQHRQVSLDTEPYSSTTGGYKEKLVTAAERRGYDTNRLQWIEQF